jgi:hypothetical protein
VACQTYGAHAATCPTTGSVSGTGSEHRALRPPPLPHKPLESKGSGGSVFLVSTRDGINAGSSEGRTSAYERLLYSAPCTSSGNEDSRNLSETIPTRPRPDQSRGVLASRSRRRCPRAGVDHLGLI